MTLIKVSTQHDHTEGTVLALFDNILGTVQKEVVSIVNFLENTEGNSIVSSTYFCLKIIPSGNLSFLDT